MVFLHEHVAVANPYMIELYTIPVLDGNEPPNVQQLRPLQCFRWNRPVWQTTFINHSAPLLSHSVSVIIRSNSSAMAQFSLGYSVLDRDHTLQHEPTRIYNTHHDRTDWWVTRLCPGSTGSRAIWMTGERGKTHNTYLTGCSLMGSNAPIPHLWQLPGDTVTDVCRHLEFDDALGIVVTATAQGHI